MNEQWRSWVDAHVMSETRSDVLRKKNRMSGQLCYRTML